MVGEALKNPFLAAVRSLCFAHTISKFAKLLIKNKEDLGMTCLVRVIQLVR